MKTKATLVAVLLAALLPMAVSAQTHVRGYVRRDGTYVAPHYRSSPNNTRADNYSTRGNVNPYTGQVGTRDPYAQPRQQSMYNTQPAYGSEYSQGDDSGH